MDLDRIREIALITASLATVTKIAYDIKENERKKKEEKQKKRPHRPRKKR